MQEKQKTGLTFFFFFLLIWSATFDICTFVTF